MAYTVIADSDIDPDSPLTTTLMTNLRDNSLPYKIIDIGDWNMDTSASATIAHGLTLADIRAIKVTIRNDANSAHIDLNQFDFTETGNHQIVANATNIVLFRGTGGPFDTTSYDSTSYNRGWITIWYIL
jgi:hypothetical protein